jgi:hypothetical protein
MMRVMSKRGWLLAAAAAMVVSACSPYRQESPGRIETVVFAGRLSGFVAVVGGTSASDLFAAGSIEATGCQGRTLAIARWDGTRWTDTMVPSGFGRAAAMAVVSSSEAYVIAEGCNSPVQGAAFLRWNGTAWTQIGFAEAGAVGSLSVVQALGPSSVWFATDSAFAYWNGTEFRLAPPTSGTQQLRGFAARSATDVFALTIDPFMISNSGLRRFKDGVWSVVTEAAVRDSNYLVASDNGTMLLSTVGGLVRWSGDGAPAGPINGNARPVSTLLGQSDGSYFVERASCVQPCSDLNNMLCRAACSYSTSRGTATGERGWPKVPVAYFRTSDGRFYEWRPGSSLELQSFE